MVGRADLSPLQDVGQLAQPFAAPSQDFWQPVIPFLFIYPTLPIQNRVQKQRTSETMKTARSRAEMEFAATQRKAKRAQIEHEIALQERAEHIARLRALRLAKEAGERERAKKASTTTDAGEGTDSSN